MVAAVSALAASLLVAVGAGASLLHGPALADDPDGPTASGTKYVLGESTGEGIVQESSEPFDLSYVTDDDSQAVVAFRPAAAFRRSGMGVYRTMLNVWIGQQWAKAATALKFDPTQPGQKPLTVDLFEQVSASVRIFRTKGPKPNGRLAAINVHDPDDRTDRLGGAPPTVQDERHRGTRRRPGLLPVEGYPARSGSFLLLPRRPDCRVHWRRVPCRFGEAAAQAPPPRDPTPRARIRAGQGLGPVSPRASSSSPSTIAGGAWRSPSRGTALWMGHYPQSTSLVEHADLWALGLDDDDQIVFRGVGTCPDGGACESTARAIGDLLDLARKDARDARRGNQPRRAGEEKAYRMAQAFLKGMRVEREGHSVLVRSAGLGTLADFASLVAAGVIEF